MKAKCLFLIVCALMIFTLPIHASTYAIPIEDSYATIDYSSQTVTVTAKTVATSKYDKFTLSAYYEDGTPIYFYESKEANPEEFQIGFIISDRWEENKGITIKLGGDFQNVEMPLTYYGTNFRTEKLAELKAQTTNSAFTAMLDTLKDVFGLNMVDYNMSSLIADEVGSSMMQMANTLTVDNIGSIHRQQTIYYIFKHASNDINLNLLNRYNDLLDLDIQDGSLFYKLTDKLPVYQAVSNGAEKFSDIKTIFENSTVLTAFSTFTRENMDSLIQEYAQEIQSAYMDTYANLNAYDKMEIAIALELVDKFDDFAAVRNTMDQKIAQIINKKNNFVATPSGGGGGGGGKGMNFGHTTPVDNQQTSDGNLVSGKRFTDIDSVPWAEEGICYLADIGVINGVSQGIFAPEQVLTRSQFVKMLVLAFQLNTAGSECNFTDVPVDFWAYPYISVAYKNGLVHGLGDGNFGIDQPVTRQDMAVLIYRFMEWKNRLPAEHLTPLEFTDKVFISAYSLQAVEKMQRSGIIQGFEDGSFRPNEPCNRAMAAKVLYQAVKH